jgi:hypothetical protein
MVNIHIFWRSDQENNKDIQEHQRKTSKHNAKIFGYKIYRGWKIQTEWNIPMQQDIYIYIHCHIVYVTIDGVSIGEWIYWLLIHTIRNYKQLQNHR